MTNKTIDVKAHKRYDPRIDKKVDVNSYQREQEVNQFKRIRVSSPPPLIEKKERVIDKENAENLRDNTIDMFGLMFDVLTDIGLANGETEKWKDAFEEDFDAISENIKDQSTQLIKELTEED